MRLTHRHRLMLPICMLVLSLTLACFVTFEPRPSLEFDPSELPDAQLGVPYEAKITVTNNVTPVFSMSISEDSLPNGLTMEYEANNSFAKITGIPTQAGTFTFKVYAMCFGTNVSGQTGEMEYTIEVQ